jgi:solute:Na+ symporter, SSS family
MYLGWIDIIIFVGFMGFVVTVSLWAGRRERGSEDYFLAGRGLVWPLIGFSLIASNISTEHFVGMAGQAFTEVGFAIASYEWIAAITLVVVALWLLPKFLKAGIYTMPQFLEFRYDSAARTTMSIYLLVLTIVAVLVTVLYSGSRGLDGVFGFSQMLVDRLGMTPRAAVFWATWGGAWCIGIIAATYTIYGGLKAVVWSDLIQGGALLLGGAIVLFLGLRLLGDGSIFIGWSTFVAENPERLHTMKPASDPHMPWTIMIVGIWIPNFFYWGMNQFITQRTLGARSLAEAQKGVFLACAMKLAIPFIIVVPGIIAFQLFGEQILARAGGDAARAGELAYPFLIREIMPPVLRGVMLAALAGAVMSTFNSGINSASTLFTVDIYDRFIKPGSTPKDQVRVGRISTGLIALAACLMAPLPGLFAGVFNYIQEIWGFISPAIVTVFFFGILVPRAPAACGRAALWIGPAIYALFRVPGWIMSAAGYRTTEAGVVRVIADGQTEPVSGAVASIYQFTQITFLHHMSITLGLLCVLLIVMTVMWPLSQPKEMPVSNVNVTPHPLRFVFGGGIVVATVALYLLFW